MNRMTTVVLSTTSIIALVLLSASGSIVGEHQALAYDLYGSHSGYYGPLGPYYGQPCYYGCYGSPGYHP